MGERGEDGEKSEGRWEWGGLGRGWRHKPEVEGSMHGRPSVGISAKAEFKAGQYGRHLWVPC